MRYRVLLAFLAMVALLPMASASPIFISNFSFETPEVPGAGGGYRYPDATFGWGVAGGIVTVGEPTLAQIAEAVPDGDQVVYVNTGATASQQLATDFVAEKRYTLKVFVGDRSDVVFGGYRIQLYAYDPATQASTLLAQDNNTQAGLINNNFEPVELAYITPTSGGPIGKRIEIRLVNPTTSGATIAAFDAVTLDVGPVIPEPVSFLLIGSALVAIGFMRFRKS